MARRRAERAAERGESPIQRRIWNPPGHWKLLALCGFVIAVVLVFQGVATHTIGASTEASGDPDAGAPLAGKRPILAAQGDRLVSVQPPPGRRIGLTFDDGPDPEWTPKIAKVLRDANVRATFFVVGSQAARHPDIIRMLVRDGHEIGDHTFTHSSLSNGPLWQREQQLGLTESVLAGITGHYSRFFRPPYSATPEAVTPEIERQLARLAGRRYLLALADYDGKDWQRNSAEQIVENASPKGTTGGIVLLHDGGGDRAQTVDAVRRMIPRLRARGFRFATLSDMAGVSAAVASPPVTGWDRFRGRVFETSVRIAYTMIDVFSVLLLAIGFLVALRAVLLLCLASHHARSTRRRPGAPEFLPSVAVVVPAFNEEVGIAAAVRSLAESDYPKLQIVVVDDGSTDSTAEIIEQLGLPQVQLVRKDNGGKASALNTGIDLSDADVVVMVDGDTLFEPDTIRRLVAPLADPRVGAVAGNTKVGNRATLLGKWQHIEYVIGFNLDRRMYEVLQCTPTIPGAVGAFRRSLLDDIGGVPGDTLAEDTDMTLAIGRGGWRVVYAEDARAWTEAPSTLGTLWRQRYRWSYGTMQAVWKHRSAMWSRDRRQRKIGRRALPYMLVFQIVLPVLSPLIDLFALYGIIFTDPVRVIGAWLLFNLLQLVVAVFAFRLDREPLRPLWALPLQQFVYRQMMYLVIIESTVSALKGMRSGWKHLPRTGDVVVGTATEQQPSAP